MANAMTEYQDEFGLKVYKRCSVDEKSHAGEIGCPSHLQKVGGPLHVAKQEQEMGTHSKESTRLRLGLLHRGTTPGDSMLEESTTPDRQFCACATQGTRTRTSSSASTRLR